MNNKPLTDRQTQRLIRKMYEGEITDHEMERLLHHFQAMGSIPPKWKADAIMVRTLAVQAYCAKTQNAFEQELNRLANRPKPAKRPPMAAKQAWAPYCAMALVVLIAVLPFWNSMPKAMGAKTADYGGEMLMYCANGCPGEQVMKTFKQTLRADITTNNIDITTNTVMA